MRYDETGKNKFKSSAAANIKTEGPTITPEERQRFLDAIKRYSTTTKGSKERLMAIESALPVLVRGYKAKKDEASDPEEREILLSIREKILEMASELKEGCSSSDPDVRHLAFSIISKVGSIRNIANIAKDNEYEDMRRAAVKYFTDAIAEHYRKEKIVEITIDPNYGSLIEKSVIENKDVTKEKAKLSPKDEKLVEYYKHMLADIAITGTYADVRDIIVDYFRTRGERRFLDAIAKNTKYLDTKRRALRALSSIQLVESEEITLLAQKFLERVFPGAVEGDKPLPPSSSATAATYNDEEETKFWLSKKKPRDGENVAAAAASA
jgi:hypothetical protein